jgi:hypothetical protein
MGHKSVITTMKYYNDDEGLVIFMLNKMVFIRVKLNLI